MSELSIEQQRLMDLINQQIGLLVQTISSGDLTLDRKAEYIELGIENLEDLYMSLCDCIPMGISSFKEVSAISSIYPTLAFILERLYARTYSEDYVKLIQSLDKKQMEEEGPIDIEKVHNLVKQIEIFIHNLPEHKQSDYKAILEYASGLAEYYRDKKTH